MRSTWKTGAVAAIVALLALPALSALPTAASASPPGSGFGFGFGFGHHPLRHAGGRPTPGAAVVNVESGPYGPVLVVGGAGAGLMPATSGTPAGYLFPAGTSLYMPTIDPPTYGTSFFHPYQPGCTTVVVVSEADGPLSCTGLETDPTADWPAFTTQAPPVAGTGVNRFLLGSVYRADLGAFQVTYAGHPLYLFDPGPDSFFGANFFEPAQPLPPEQTAWYLVSPQGTPATGPATLETEAPQPGTTYSSNELAAELLPAFGGVAVSVYTFSGDSHFSHCYDACARDFLPGDHGRRRRRSPQASTRAPWASSGGPTGPSRSPTTATRCTSTARSSPWSGAADRSRPARRATAPASTPSAGPST